MDAGHSLISELEDAIQSGSKDKRVDSLRRITDLFVADANRLNDQQIDVFDDVLCHLIKRIEGKALEEAVAGALHRSIKHQATSFGGSPETTISRWRRRS